MQIGEGLTVLVNYDYQPSETGDQYTPPVAEGVTIYTVCFYAPRRCIDIIDILSHSTIETIEKNILDSFDKDMQEPERESGEGADYV